MEATLILLQSLADQGESVHGMSAADAATRLQAAHSLSQLILAGNGFHGRGFEVYSSPVNPEPMVLQEIALS